MANTLYDLFVNSYMTGGANLVDLDTDDIRVILVDAADYTFSQTHDYLDDVPGAARVATAALTSESVTNRTFDAADTTFSSVTGDESEALILYNHTGTEGTSRLIAYIDTATNLPITPNGGDITVSWDDGANKIFTL
jgi:hypothetical protein